MRSWDALLAFGILFGSFMRGADDVGAGQPQVSQQKVFVSHVLSMNDTAEDKRTLFISYSVKDLSRYDSKYSQRQQQ